MITLKVIKINEDKVKSTLITKVKFSDLDKIAKLTHRLDNEDYFQRDTDIGRVNKIAEFIKERMLDVGGNFKRSEDVLTLFPTSMILALNKDSDVEQESYRISDDILEIESGVSAYIVDGQHRFMGIKKFYEVNNMSYDSFDIELPLIILLDYDLYEQATIFIDVNFKQKAVNKSFYYDIFGSLPGKKNDLQLAHYLVKYLNNTEKSPFFNLVKMLGTGKGVISQAFLVENILKLFKREHIFSSFFYNYEKGGDQQKEIARILLSYFKSVKEKFSDYIPQEGLDGDYSVFGQDILFKTTGVGALMQLLNYLKGEVLEIYNDSKKIDEYFNYIFSLFGKNDAKELFSKEGDYAKGGGGGLQSKLYLKLKEIIDFRKDVVGKTYQNSKITTVNKTRDESGRDLYELLFDNGTATKIGADVLNQIRITKNGDI